MRLSWATLGMCLYWSYTPPYIYNSINIDSGEIMTCCLSVSSHYLNQWCLIISELLWHSHEGYFTGDAQDIYPWYEFENRIYSFEITAISHRGNVLLKSSHMEQRPRCGCTADDICKDHYSDVTWPSWRLKSPATPCLSDSSKQISKVRVNGPLWRDSMVPLTRASTDVAQRNLATWKAFQSDGVFVIFSQAKTENFNNDELKLVDTFGR